MSNYPIVGMFFHPPAKALVLVLSPGTPLTVMAEPSNPADANAIGIYLKSSDIPEGAKATLEEELPSYGLSLEELLAQEEWMLGYIPKALAAELKSSGKVTDDEPIPGLFSLSSSGTPRVIFGD